MATFKVTGPDGQTYKVTAPDNATEDDVLKRVQAKNQQDSYAQTAQQSSTTENFLAGVGGGMYGMGLGVGQMLGLTDDETIQEHSKAMGGLRTTTSGKIGEFVGVAAPAAATAVIPGANTLTGSALVGAATGASQPVLEGESRWTNTALGAGGGLAGQYIGNKLAGAGRAWLANKQAGKALKEATNATRDTTLKASKEAGYVVPPSYSGANTKWKIAEGLSGKYKTNQLAGIRNQEVTNRLAKQAVGLDQGDEITKEILKGIRQGSHEAAYNPIRKLGKIETDGQFTQSLDDIVSRFQGASKSFPNAVDDNVSKMVDNLRVEGFDASDAIDMVQILRDNAKAAYRAGDNALGKASRNAATALEDQIERHLSAGGKKAKAMLNSFKEARKLMAKTHTVEDALVEGSGNVDAVKLARQLNKGAPLSGELKTAAKFGQTFGDVARVPKSGDANPLTIIDIGYGGLGGVVDPTLMTLPAARVASRYSILSNPAQRMMNPDYSIGLLGNTVPRLMDNPATVQGLRAGVPAGLLTYPAE